MQTRSETLIIGAGATVRALGTVLARSAHVRIVDSNAEHCAAAEADGLDVVHGNALDKALLRRAGVEEADTVIAATPNAEVNALAAQLVRSTFSARNIHVLRGDRGSGHDTLLDHLKLSTLFAGPVVLPDWDYWIQHDRVDRSGLNIERPMSPKALFDELQEWAATVPLAIRRDDRYLPYHGGSDLRLRDRVIVLRAREVLPGRYDRFDRLVARCPVLDLNKRMTIEEFFRLAAAALSDELRMTTDALMKRFVNRETAGSTVIAPGLAIPHVLIAGKEEFHVLIARCRDGIDFPGQRESVHAVFMLVRSRDERNFHLRALAAVAQTVQDPDFEVRWLQASGPEELRKIVLQSERRRFPEREHSGHS